MYWKRGQRGIYAPDNVGPLAAGRHGRDRACYRAGKVAEACTLEPVRIVEACPSRARRSTAANRCRQSATSIIARRRAVGRQTPASVLITHGFAAQNLPTHRCAPGQALLGVAGPACAVTLDLGTPIPAHCRCATTTLLPRGGWRPMGVDGRALQHRRPAGLSGRACQRRVSSCHASAGPLGRESARGTHKSSCLMTRGPRHHAVAARLHRYGPATHLRSKNP